jgi:putative ABC transport system permease protein
MRLMWLTTGVTNLFRRRRLDSAVHDEIAFHLDERTADLVRRGFEPAEARRVARAEFGGIESCAERTREAWGFRLIGDLRQDARHALRMFAGSPGFTAIAVLSIAIGIGANASIFSVADALVFRPLGVRDPGRVMSVGLQPPEETRGIGSMSYPNYLEFRDRVHAFDGVVAHQLVTFSFAASRDAAPDMRAGLAVSDNFFDTLGILPVLGRAFTPDQAHAPGEDAVLVLGHDFWSGVLGADRSVVGREVWLNGVPVKVIGVAPERFTGMDQYIRPALFVPVSMLRPLSGDRDRSVEDRSARIYDLHARLRSGISLHRAQEEAGAAWTALSRQYPEANRHLVLAVRTEFQTRLRNNPEDVVTIVLLLALVALVLAIACANVANLLLGRARSRAREIAIRLALGVSRARLLRQLMTESVLLALAGCAGGIALATAAVRVLRDIRIPSDLPIVIEPRLDERLLVFSLCAAALSVLLFGIAPAVSGVRTNLVGGLKAGMSGRATRHRLIGRSVLVVAQVGLSMILLISAGTMLEGFHRLLEMNPGFRTDHLLMMAVDTELTNASPERSHVFYRELVDRASRLPGVASVTMTGAVPLDPNSEGNTVVPEGYELRQGQRGVGVQLATVDAHYFSTMRTGIVAGRTFNDDDRATSVPVVIVNEEFGRRYWPGRNPLGQRLRLADAADEWMTVVGVARTGKYFFLGEAPQPFIYLPFVQHERSRMSIIVESASDDPTVLAMPLRQLVRNLSPDQPVYNVRALSTFYEQRALAIPRRTFHVVTTMGVAGLVLALVGLYGLVAYSVASRSQQIGIRMAIGARPSNVLALVLRQGCALALIGVAVGLIGSMAATRVLIAGLYGLAAPNRAAYIAVPLLLIALTLIASYIPARRASLIDPLRAVRHE